MEMQKIISALCFFFLLTGSESVRGSSSGHKHHHRHQHHRHHRRYEEQQKAFKPTKLFVFGDSYADTGNSNKSNAHSWHAPYGITFPGEPAGRYSDGRVLTDYIAMFLGIRSPVPYTLRGYAGKSVANGMNFAYGRTGVFDTDGNPNMTTQIDFFQQMIHQSVYTQNDLQSSIALVTLAGNDYDQFNSGNNREDIISFFPKVVIQLAKNLKRIHGMGVKKVLVTAIEPLGCLPRSTVASSYKSCNATENLGADYHNFLLKLAVAKLNLETLSSSTFIILNLYDSFMSALANKGTSMFESPLRSCCQGVADRDSCGNTGDHDERKYTVCENRTTAFFWDVVHPTQQGWSAIYYALQSTLARIY